MSRNLTAAEAAAMAETLKRIKLRLTDRGEGEALRLASAALAAIEPVIRQTGREPLQPLFLVMLSIKRSLAAGRRTDACAATRAALAVVDSRPRNQELCR